MQVKSLELIAKAGFDAAEFSHIEHLCKSDMLAIAKAARGMGVEPWSAHSWQAIPGDAAAAKDALAEFDDFLGKSELLGVEVVVVHCAGDRENLADPAARERRRSANLACIEPLAERTAKTGASVAIENGTSWAEWQFFVDMVRDLQHPSVGLNIDTGHANLGDMNPAKAIQAARPLLITTHIQDNYGKVDDHLPPGLGVIDWPSVVAALKEVGYSGVYMVEISDCPPNREPDAPVDIQAAYDNLARLVKR